MPDRSCNGQETKIEKEIDNPNEFSNVNKENNVDEQQGNKNIQIKNKKSSSICPICCNCNTIDSNVPNLKRNGQEKKIEKEIENPNEFSNVNEENNVDKLAENKNKQRKNEKSSSICPICGKCNTIDSNGPDQEKNKDMSTKKNINGGEIKENVGNKANIKNKPRVICAMTSCRCNNIDSKMSDEKKKNKKDEALQKEIDNFNGMDNFKERNNEENKLFKKEITRSIEISTLSEENNVELKDTENKEKIIHKAKPICPICCKGNKIDTKIIDQKEGEEKNLTEEVEDKSIKDKNLTDDNMEEKYSKNKHKRKSNQTCSSICCKDDDSPVKMLKENQSMLQDVKDDHKEEDPKITKSKSKDQTSNEESKNINEVSKFSDGNKNVKVTKSYDKCSIICCKDEKRDKNVLDKSIKSQNENISQDGAGNVDEKLDLAKDNRRKNSEEHSEDNISENKIKTSNLSVNIEKDKKTKGCSENICKNKKKSKDDKVDEVKLDKVFNFDSNVTDKAGQNLKKQDMKTKVRQNSPILCCQDKDSVNRNKDQNKISEPISNVQEENDDTNKLIKHKTSDSTIKKQSRTNIFCMEISCMEKCAVVKNNIIENKLVKSDQIPKADENFIQDANKSQEEFNKQKKSHSTGSCENKPFELNVNKNSEKDNVEISKYKEKKESKKSDSGCCKNVDDQTLKLDKSGKSKEDIIIKSKTMSNISGEKNEELKDSYCDIKKKSNESLKNKTDIGCCNTSKSKNIKQKEVDEDELNTAKIPSFNKLDRSLMNSRFSAITDEKEEKKINKTPCQLCKTKKSHEIEIKNCPKQLNEAVLLEDSEILFPPKNKKSELNKIGEKDELKDSSNKTKNESEKEMNSKALNINKNDKISSSNRKISPNKCCRNTDLLEDQLKDQNLKLQTLENKNIQQELFDNKVKDKSYDKSKDNDDSTQNKLLENSLKNNLNMKSNIRNEKNDPLEHNEQDKSSCCLRKKKEKPIKKIIKDVEVKNKSDEIQLKNEIKLSGKARSHEESITLIKKERIYDPIKREQLADEKRKQEKILRSLEEDRKILKARCEAEARQKEEIRLLEKAKREQEINDYESLWLMKQQSKKWLKNNELNISNNEFKNACGYKNEEDKSDITENLDIINSVKHFQKVSIFPNSYCNQSLNKTLNPFVVLNKDYKSVTNVNNSDNNEVTFGLSKIVPLHNTKFCAVNMIKKSKFQKEKVKCKNYLKLLEKRRKCNKIKSSRELLNKTKCQKVSNLFVDPQLNDESKNNNIISFCHDECSWTSASTSSISLEKIFNSKTDSNINNEDKEKMLKIENNFGGIIDCIFNFKNNGYKCNKNNSNRNNNGPRFKKFVNDLPIEKREIRHSIYNRRESKIRLKIQEDRKRENMTMSSTDLTSETIHNYVKYGKYNLDYKEKRKIKEIINSKEIIETSCCKRSEIINSVTKTIKNIKKNTGYVNNESLNIESKEEDSYMTDDLYDLEDKDILISMKEMSSVTDIKNDSKQKEKNAMKNFEDMKRKELKKKHIKKPMTDYLDDDIDLTEDDPLEETELNFSVIYSKSISINRSKFENKKDSDFQIVLDDPENPKFWPTYVYRIKQQFLPKTLIVCVLKAKYGGIGKQSNLKINMISFDKVLPNLDLRENAASIAFEICPSEEKFEFKFDPTWRLIIPHRLSGDSKHEVVIMSLDDKEDFWQELITTETVVDELKDEKLRFVETKLEKPFGTFIVMTKTKIDSGLINKNGVRITSSIDSRMFISVPPDALKITLNATLKVTAVNDKFWSELKSKSEKSVLEQVICSSHLININCKKKKLLKPAIVNCFLPLNPEIKMQQLNEVKVSKSENKVIIDDKVDDENSNDLQTKPEYSRIEFNQFQKSILMGISGASANENVQMISYFADEDRWYPVDNLKITTDKSKELLSVELPIIQSLKYFIVRAKRMITLENLAKSMRIIEQEFTVRNAIIILFKSTKNPTTFILSICLKKLLEDNISNMKDKGFQVELQNDPISVELKERQIITVKCTGNICNIKENENIFNFRFQSIFPNAYKFRVTEIDSYAQRAIDHYRGYLKIYTKQFIKKAIEVGEQKNRKNNIQYQMVEEDVMVCQLLISIPKKKIIIFKSFKNTVFNKQLLDCYIGLFAIIAGAVGVSWKDLGVVLHISDSRLQSIQHHNKRNEYERMMVEMLIFWLKGLQMVDNKPELLMKALSDINRHDLVTEIKRYLENEDEPCSDSIS